MEGENNHLTMGGALSDESPGSNSDDEATYWRRNQQDDWLNIFQTPEENFTYNPKNSYAVCAGVGKQLYVAASDLGPAADNDASMIYDTLTGHLGFPTDHVRLLTSGTTPAIRDIVKAALQVFARDVPSDGVLLFHFSGHCNRARGQAVLVPADYNNTWESVISVFDLNEALKEARAKYVILILDCCYAGKLAEDMLFGQGIETPTYVLAACNSREKSLSFADLGNGFFTFFVNRYLRDQTQQGEFPGRRFIDYCVPLVEALTALLRPIRKDVYMMTPMSVYKDVKAIASLFGNEALEDEVDAALAWTVPAYLLQLFNQDEPMPVIPDSLCDWLARTVESALGDLHNAGVLTSPVMYNAVLAMMSQSIAAILCDAKTEISELDALAKSNTFLLCYLRICETFDHVDPRNQELVPKLTHMETCLVNYVKMVCHAKGVEFAEDVFDDIIKLLTRILYEKEKTQRSKRKADNIEDEVDSGSGDRAEAVKLLRNLPRIHGVPELPQIE
ncbi:uncharacterized protein [Ptychodera flava]|uniref:uncharacterized protein n=1 Tax=Ptychodera flava TaxID=63121 RepID=UPI003969BD0A